MFKAGIFNGFYYEMVKKVHFPYEWGKNPVNPLSYPLIVSHLKMQKKVILKTNKFNYKIAYFCCKEETNYY
mgnify:CR=1 FL=1